MNFTPHNIFQYAGKEYSGKLGTLRFRLMADGWEVVFKPHALHYVREERIDGQDVWSACAFANAREA